MLKPTYFVILVALVFQGSLGKPVDNESCRINHRSMMDLISEINSKLDRILAIPHIARDLSSQKVKTHSKKEAEPNRTKNHGKKIQSSFEVYPTTTVKPPPPQFELIGKRSFYIERNVRKNWDDAADACREIGGYLAAFESEEELTAVKAKLPWSWWTWSGINNLKTDMFVSLASGKPSAVYQKKNDNDKTTHGKSCIGVDRENLATFNCITEMNFICQKDKDT